MKIQDRRGFVVFQRQLVAGPYALDCLRKDPPIDEVLPREDGVHHGAGPKPHIANSALCSALVWEATLAKVLNCMMAQRNGLWLIPEDA